MNFLFAHRTARGNRSGYATDEDFCKLFTSDVNSLYLLSFLLTADHNKAEQCFASGLDDCVNGNPVADEWARSWIRRIIIRNAIRITAPHFHSATRAAVTIESPGADPLRDIPLGFSMFATFANVLALEDSERIVFVLSFLERYTDRECAALLSISRQQLQSVRIRALEHISGGEPTIVPNGFLN